MTVRAKRDGRSPRPASAFSVIVPVRNEAAVIALGAAHLLDGLPARTELVYVCNGCSDDSAAILRRTVGDRALVIERAYAGKAAAIREAECHVTCFPRFFVDADVRIKGYDLVKLAARLVSDELELISPRISMDHTGSSWPARALADMWLNLPHARDGGFHGVLGVSRDGRQRWGEFPEVLADDAFIEAQIPTDRKAIEPNVRVVVRFPRTVWSFVRVRARWLRGHRELERLGIKAVRSDSQFSTLVRTTLTKEGVLPGALYITARLLAIFVSYYDEVAGGWYSDRTSRQVPLS